MSVTFPMLIIAIIILPIIIALVQWDRKRPVTTFHCTDGTKVKAYITGHDMYHNPTYKFIEEEPKARANHARH